jgi:Zn-dependent metalloprotease
MGASGNGERLLPHVAKAGCVVLWAVISSCGPESADDSQASAQTQPVLQPPEAGCYHSAYDGHDYWVCPNDSTFDEARTKCQAVGMDLANIDDSDENKFIKKKVWHDSFIGLTDRSVEGAWRWVADNKLTWCGDTSGEATSATSYTNWEHHEPRVSDCKYKISNGRAYWFCDEETTFADAVAACQTVGMSLARVIDSAENQFIRGHASGWTWLGATDSAQEGDWRWLEGNALFWTGGQNGHAVGSLYSKWSSGKPTGYGNDSDCLAMSTNGSWSPEKCDHEKEWVCEGPPGQQGSSPDTHDCAVMEKSGHWEASKCNEPQGYVCETVPDTAKTIDDVAELIRDEYRTGKPRVSHMDFRATSLVQEPFIYYGQRLGLRDCVDSLQPRGDARPISATGLEALDYHQFYSGIRVHTRGYVVHRDPATHAVKSLTGRFEHNIAIDTHPKVSKTTARTSALNAIGVKPSHQWKYPFQSELVVFPTKQGRDPNWDLAWLFSQPPNGAIETFAVAVSASTGKVLFQSDSLEYQCGSVNLAATPPQQSVSLTVDALPQAAWGDPNGARGSQVAGSSPFALYSPGVGAPGSPLASSPKIHAHCAGADDDVAYPKVVGLSSATVSVNSSSSEAAYASALYMSAQRCLEYLASDFEQKPGTAWLGFDGAGLIDITIRMRNTTPGGFVINSPFFNAADFSINFKPTFNTLNQYLGASIETVCHELTHGVFDMLTTPVSGTIKDLESSALAEGFSDILGSAAEMSFRGYPQPPGVTSDFPMGWCFQGDANNNEECLRDFAVPEFSSDDGCEIQDINGNDVYTKCSSDYLGPNYCTFVNKCSAQTGAVECCTPHANSTILSHWFFLLSQGQIGQSSTCSYAVEPLHQTLSTSTKKASLILFNAVRDQGLASMTGYQGIADATITSAINLYGLNSPEAASVAHAWFAVNVKEESFFEADAVGVTPARETIGVYPWVTFQWPIHPGESAWDFQLSNGPFGPVLFETSGITTQTTEGSKQVGYLKLALPFKSGERFFWRTRPHSTDQWPDCFPIHSFVGTTEPESITNVKISPTDSTTGEVAPGKIQLSWNSVKGAEKFKLFLATTDANCNSGSGVIEAEVAAGSPFPGLEQAELAGVQPLENYTLNVLPIGPNGFNGQPSEGECYKQQFKTKAMQAPILTKPLDGAVLDYQNLVDFEWFGLNGPEKYRVEVFDIDEQGNCEATPALSLSITQPCEDSCIASLNTPFPLVNPTGYCWTVTSIAKNGKESPAANPPHLFIYYVHAQNHTTQNDGSPGVQIAEAAGLLGALPANPSPIPSSIGNTSYGDSVTLTWGSLPNAYAYQVAVGRWPWKDNGTVTPPKCYDEGGNSCLLGPGGVPFEQLVVGSSSVSVAADLAGKGRYCWDVWPVLAEPGVPGVEWARQPLVSIVPYCYTTGPAPPKVTIAKSGSGTGEYPDAPVTGKITVEYVPDFQMTLFPDSPDVEFDFTNCQLAADAYVYGDFYNCEISFTLIPQSGASYEVGATVYASDLHPPVIDSSTKVYEDSHPFFFGPCGENFQACCLDPNGAQFCNSSALFCKDLDGGFPECRKCGGAGEECCPASTCGSGNTCNATTGKCEPICQPVPTPTNIFPGVILTNAAFALANYSGLPVASCGSQVSWDPVGSSSTTYLLEQADYQVFTDPNTQQKSLGPPLISSIVLSTNAAGIFNIQGACPGAETLIEYRVSATTACGTSPPSARVFLITN